MMIKFIQKRLYRKGFTLVELIVVIAIIAVLAAILIPTLTSSVKRAKITSANSDANNIRKAVNLFFTEAEGYGMVQADSAIEVLNVTVTGGIWVCSNAANPGNFFDISPRGITWGRGGAANAVGNGIDVSASTSGEQLMMAEIYSELGTIHDASMVIVLKGGACTFVAFSSGNSAILNVTEYPTITNGLPSANFEWDGKTSGIAPGGKIIGTSPKILRPES